MLAKLSAAPGLVLSFYRMWIASAVLVGVVLLAGRRLTWELLRRSFLGGVLLAVDMGLFFSAVNMTSVAIASVISALQPILVMVAAGPWLGERVNRRDVVWTLMAIAGVIMTVAGSGSPSHRAVVGDCLAAGSLVAWSGYFLVSRRARIEVDALDYTAGVTIVAALTLSLSVLPEAGSLAAVHRSAWLWLVLLAVVPGAAHVLMNWAQRYQDLALCSAIASANPIVAIVAADVILGQHLFTVQLCGGIVGVAAIVIMASRQRDPIAPGVSPVVAPATNGRTG